MDGEGPDPAISTTPSPPAVRPLRPAFPAQESTTAASAPETRSCYQHQSALPHYGGALAERRPRPKSLPGSQESCWPMPGFSVRFGLGGVQGPTVLRHCHHLNFLLGRAGVADPDSICLCFAGQNLFPQSKLFLRREQARSWGRGEAGALISFGLSVNIIY